MIGRTVTIWQATTSPTPDRYGDATLGTATPKAVGDCIVAPRLQIELNGTGRDGTFSGLTLYAPPGTVIRPDDRVEIDGVLYDVDGEVGVWQAITRGGQAGLEVALKRTAG